MQAFQMADGVLRQGIQGIAGTNAFFGDELASTRLQGLNLTSKIGNPQLFHQQRHRQIRCIWRQWCNASSTKGNQQQQSGCCKHLSFRGGAQLGPQLKQQDREFVCRAHLIR
jgi:hypothetical protein